MPRKHDLSVVRRIQKTNTLVDATARMRRTSDETCAGHTASRNETDMLTGEHAAVRFA